MTSHSLEGARRRRDAIRVAIERGGGGGHDGGMAPDAPWKERDVELEENVDSLMVMAKDLSEKVDKLSERIGRQSDIISASAEGVATVERRLKHFPSIWSMLVGQVLTACTVAGLLIAAFDHGWTIAKDPTQTTQSTPSRSDNTGSGERMPTGGGGDGREKLIKDKAN